MGKYDRQIGLANSLITKYGLENATIMQFADDGYDPLTDSPVNEVKNTFTTSVCFVPQASGDDVLFGANTAIEDEQAKILIPAEGSSFTPKPGDRIIPETPADPNAPSPLWWSIERMTILAPDGVSIMYMGVATRGRQPF